MPIAESSAADGGRDQADEQRHQHGRPATRAAGSHAERERQQGDRGEQEDDRHAGQQDVERDLVRRLLALGALDQRDHPVEERLARVRR